MIIIVEQDSVCNESDDNKINVLARSANISNELLFSLAQKRSEPIHTHYCEHNNYTEGRGIISWWVFLKKKTEIKKLKIMADK